MKRLWQYRHDALLVAGLGCVLYALRLVAPPLAWAVLGVALITWALIGSWLETKP